MAVGLHTLKPAKGSVKKKFVIGRGHGSGLVKTAGRGTKGQRARSGVSGLKLKGFRAQMLSMPKKRGFQSLEKKYVGITLDMLEKHFVSGGKITDETLRAKGLLRRSEIGAKILSNGAVKHAFVVFGVPCTAKAKEAIEKAGGSVR